MTRKLKILISCVYLAFSRLAATLMRPFQPGNAGSLIILYYHGVSGSQRANFARQMDLLQRHASIVHADWRGGLNKRRACAITFDDAFDSTIANALPELKSRQFPCTIFVPAGVMGRKPDWDMEEVIRRNESVADAETIRQLSSPLVVIGSHTMSHCRMSCVPPERARNEAECSRFLLNEVIGQDTRMISFPYGDHNNEVVKICESAGYDLMYTIDPVPVDPRGESRVRGRVSVSPDDSLLEFYLKSAGGYRWMPVASAIKRWFRRS